MNVTVAEAIINEVKSGGYEDKPMPEDDVGKLELANFWVGEAEKAVKAGLNNSIVTTVINLAKDGSGPGAQEVEGPSAPAAEPEETPPVEEAEEPSQADPDPAPEAAPPPVEEEVQEETPEAATELQPAPEVTAPPETSSLVQRENLPVPPEMAGDPPDMPADLTKESDLEIRRLHGVFNAYLSRLDWLVSQESMALHQAKIVFQRNYDVVRAVIPKVDAENKRRLSEDIDAEARQHESVIGWAERVDSHESALIELKGLQGIYTRWISVLSREWSMRTDEWQKSKS